MTAIENERSYLRVAERNAAANEARDDRTKQRLFELSFESRDLPYSRAAIADYSDGGRSVWQMQRKLDAKTREQRRIALINRAAARLPRDNPLLRPLLWAIYRNGKNRAETMGELGISRITYWRGVKFFLKLYSAQ